MGGLFGFFLTWWGTFLFAVLDVSIVFFMPLGIDGLVVYLAARDRDRFWLPAVMATAGSIAGGAITYWIGAKAGEKGLPRLVSRRRIDRLKARVRHAGAFAMGLPAGLPPPFPLTPFLLTCGALGVDRGRLLAVFGGVRLLRFGVEAALARRFGDRVLRLLESDGFQIVIGAFAVIAVIGTVATVVLLWRRTRG